MKIYNVIEHNRIDCYKRAETFTSPILSTTNATDAYNAAANAWLSNYIDRFDGDLSFAPGINEIREVIAESNGKAIHEVFENNSFDIFNPEYINEPTFEISIMVEELGSKSCSLDVSLIQVIKDLPEE